jgi:PKD repeat protein
MTNLSRGRPPRGTRFAKVRWVGFLAVVVVASLMVPPGAGATGALNVGRTPSIAPDPIRLAPSSSPLASAVTSLAHGAGPSAGVAMGCTISGLTSADCRPAHPALVTQRTWIKEASYPYPSGSEGLSVAWDPVDGVVLAFGGCNYYGVCPTNETWAYERTNAAWINLTADYPRAPTPRYLASLTWYGDASGGFALLFGGCSWGQGVYFGFCELNDTWAFNFTDGWVNLAGRCTTGCVAPPARFGASLVFDPALSPAGALLFGGDNSTAAVLYNSTYRYTYGVGWTLLSPSRAPPPTWGGAMVFDRLHGVPVYFGGCSTLQCASNQTWEYIGGSSGWQNETAACGGCAPMVPLFLPSMTFDTVRNETVLFGGGGAGLLGTNSTYILTSASTGWQLQPLFPAPLPVVAAAVPDTSVNGFIRLFGGDECLLCGVTNNQSFVYEVPPQFTSVSATPNPVDVNATISFSATVYGGAAPAFTCWANANLTACGVGFATASCACSGVQSLTTWIHDDADVVAFAPATILTVNPALNASATGAPNVVVAGRGAVGFHATASGGTAPYTYTWSFGDGGMALGASPSHTYATAGWVNATVNVTDVGGGSILLAVPIHVQVGVTAQLHASPPASDVAVPVRFSASVTGIMPYTFAWQFGDGATGNASAPSHAFANPGSYTARLNFTDSRGYSALSNLTIRVNAALLGTAAASTLAPSAGVAVSFSGNATSGTPPYAIAWTFGDHVSGFGSPASHAFTSAGSYRVTAWINDSGGGGIERNLTVTVTSATAPASGSSGTSSSPWVWGLLAGLAIAAVVAVAIGLRYRRRRPPSGGPSPPATVAPPPANPPPGASG